MAEHMYCYWRTLSKTCRSVKFIILWKVQHLFLHLKIFTKYFSKLSIVLNASISCTDVIIPGLVIEQVDLPHHLVLGILRGVCQGNDITSVHQHIVPHSQERVVADDHLRLVLTQIYDSNKLPEELSQSSEHQQ